MLINQLIQPPQIQTGIFQTDKTAYKGLVGRNLIGRILKGFVTNTIYEILPRTQTDSHTDTVTTHQSNPPKLVQE